VVIRNVVAGSLAKRLGMEAGTPLPVPVLEYSYKSDALGDPLVNETHIQALGLASPEEIRAIREDGVFAPTGPCSPSSPSGRSSWSTQARVRAARGPLDAGDELTPDGCRFWDRATRERLGKDRTRRSPAREAAAYQEVFPAHLRVTEKCKTSNRQPTLWRC